MAKAKASFHWDDPLLLDQQLSDDERAVRDAANAYAQDRLLPRVEGAYRHRHGSPGHGADHVLPLFAPPSLTVPVVSGRLALGTWQSICLLDPNADNATRTVRLSLLPG